MKIKVTGGTHLHIVSCYGVKVFEIEHLSLLREAIRKDRGIPESARFVSRRSYGKQKVFSFEDAKENTLFEYYYEKI